MFPLFTVFQIAFLILMSVKCNEFLMCDNNADCQVGYSCIENSCKICVNCSLIFRKGNNCESDFNDCGDCLEGYEEILVTDNSAVKKPCKPIKKKGNLKECATDNDCPPDSYCSKKTCLICFDCNLINRLKPEKCARDPNECGPCFSGYLSTGTKSRTNYKKCTKAAPDDMPSYSSATLLISSLGISSGTLLICVVFVVIFGVAALVVLSLKRLSELGFFRTIYHPSAKEVPLGGVPQNA